MTSNASPTGFVNNVVSSAEDKSEGEVTFADVMSQLNDSGTTCTLLTDISPAPTPAPSATPTLASQPTLDFSDETSGGKFEIN